jgi:hypothetical protein
MRVMQWLSVAGCVLQFKEAILMPSQLGIVMEYAAGGDLRVSCCHFTCSIEGAACTWFSVWYGPSGQHPVRVSATR